MTDDERFKLIGKPESESNRRPVTYKSPVEDKKATEQETIPRRGLHALLDVKYSRLDTPTMVSRPSSAIADNLLSISDSITCKDEERRLAFRVAIVATVIQVAEMVRFKIKIERFILDYDRVPGSAVTGRIEKTIASMEETMLSTRYE